jgi:hypothetical protein
MKVLLDTLNLALVIALTATSQNVRAVTGAIKVAQVQNTVNNKPINLALPTSADIKLRDGNSQTGRITAFDSKGKTIQVSRGNDSVLVSSTQVRQITFRKDSLFYPSPGKLVMRGEDNAKAKQSNWSGIPISKFKLINPEFGQASVDLASVKNQKELRQIQSVAVKSLYVLDEIVFEPAGKMTIKVTPSDRKRMIVVQ